MNLSKNKKQLAYEGLKNQLTEFQKYLLDQKERNSVVRFFQGNNFINGCEKYIEELQRWMTAMQLDLSLHFGEENAKNFKQLFEILSKMQETRGKSQCTFKDKFKNSNAASFWIKYFENEENVEWVEFLLNFKSFVYKTEKKELSEPILEKILKLLDSDGNKIVSFSEWDEFYEKIWSRFESKAEFLLINEINQGEKISKSPSKKMEDSKKEELPPLTLIYLETNSEIETNRKPYDFPLKHEFLIGPMGFQYQDINHSIIEKEKNLEKNALIVGRTAQNFTPDIAFSSEILTISRKQFHITTKNLLNDRGYFITDLSSANPTAFRVRDKAFALNIGMLVDVNNYLFEITEVFPIAKEDENQNNYFFMPTDGRIAADGTLETLRKFKAKNNENTKEEDCDDEEQTITRGKKKPKPKHNNDRLPYVKIRNMNGFLPKLINENKNDKFLSYKEVDDKIECTEDIKRQHETFVLTAEDPRKLALFFIGRNKGNNIRIIDNYVSRKACQIYYDQKDNGWFVVEKHPAYNQEDFSSGTLIYLKNFQQYNENKIASIGYKLRDGMEVICNEHVFGVKLQEK